jgi:sortase B
MKYINTDAKGEYALSGAIFLDSGAKNDFSDFGSVLYGHHMEKNAMFGELGRFADKDFFDERAYGSLYFGGREHGLEFFAFLHVDAYDNDIFRKGITGEKESAAYLDMLMGRAIHTRDTVKVDPAKDRIILLTTCSSSTTNGRDVLAARITDGLFEDIFKLTENAGRTGILPAVDRIVSLWSAVPHWTFPLFPATIFLTAGIYGLITDKRRNPGYTPATEGKRLPGNGGNHE